MAINAASFKSWDEKLHPRDRLGRFAKKWGMGKGLISRLNAFVDKFSFRTFPTRNDANDYIYGQALKKPEVDQKKLATKFAPTNKALEAGQPTAETNDFVSMMDKSKFPLSDDTLLYQKLPPEAFGYTMENMFPQDNQDNSLDYGGMEDLTGKLLEAKGYVSTQIGESYGAQPVTMVIAAPKGTNVVVPGGPNSPEVILDKGQNFRITKVAPDGYGGMYVMTVLDQKEGGETAISPSYNPATAHDPNAPSPKPAPTPQQPGQAPTPAPAQQAPAPAPTAQAPAAPGAPAPRTEQVLRPGSGGGPAPTPGAPATSPLAQPEEPPVGLGGKSFGDKIRDLGIPSPAAGKRRAEWNHAYLGAKSGKMDPADLLRELDSDIERNKGLRKRIDAGLERADLDLDSDIEAQERLSDAIAEHFQIDRPWKKTEAPSTDDEGETGPELPSSEGGTKATGLSDEQKTAVTNRLNRMKSEGNFNPDNPEHQRLQNLVDQIEGRATGPVAQAPAKKAARKRTPAAPPAEAPEAPAPAKAAKRTRAKKTAPPAEPDDLTQRIREAVDQPPVPRGSAEEQQRIEERTQLLREILNASDEEVAARPRRTRGGAPGAAERVREETREAVRQQSLARLTGERRQETGPGAAERLREETREGARRQATARLTPGRKAQGTGDLGETIREIREGQVEQFRATRRQREEDKELRDLIEPPKKVAKKARKGPTPAENAKRLLESKALDEQGEALARRAGVDPDELTNTEKGVLSGIVTGIKARRFTKAQAQEQLGQSLSPRLREIADSGVVLARAPRKATGPRKSTSARKAAAEAGDINAMTKDELLREAESRQVDVRKSWTKDRIKQAIIEKAESAGQVAPEGVEAEDTGPDIDRMTKAELLTHAEANGVTTRPSWTKDKIKQAIRDKDVPAPEPMTREEADVVINQANRDRRAQIRREMRAEREARGDKPFELSPEDKADIAEKARITNERVTAENAAEDAATREITDPWLRDAGLTEADLSDFERAGLMVVGSDLRSGKISHPEAVRRLRTDDPNSNLSRIADAITTRPAKAAPAPTAGPVPQKAAGTAEGKLTASRLQRGVRIRVQLDGQGGFRAATRKTGSKDLEVVDVGRSPLVSRRGRVRVTVVDENGNRHFFDASPSQTFHVQGGEAPEAPAPRKATTPGARDTVRQAHRTSEALAQIDADLVSEASERASINKINVAFRDGRITPELRDELLANRGSPQGMRDAIKRWEQANGFERIGEPGDIIPRNRAEQTDIAPGDTPQVAVVRSGHRYTDPDGNQVTLEKAAVAPVTADEAKKLKAASISRDLSRNVEDRTLKTPDRKQSFEEGWSQRFKDWEPKSTTSMAMGEIHGDLVDGKITPAEAVRRFEVEIEEGNREWQDIARQMREIPNLNDPTRMRLEKRQLELGTDIGNLERASIFTRRHFEGEPQVTPDEVKATVEASPDSPVDVRNVGERLRDMKPDEVQELKDEIKKAGFGDVDGATGEEVFDNALKKIIENELVRRGMMPDGTKAPAKKVQAAKKAAKKAAAPIEAKAPDKPLENLPESRYQRIDINALAEGLNFTEKDRAHLQEVQDLLDGKNDRLGKSPTPSAIGKDVERWINGPGGPATQAIYRRGVSAPDRENPTPRLEMGETQEQANKRVADVMAETQGDLDRHEEWKKLADRLKNTRRQPKRDTPAPTPEPKVTPDEKKRIAEVADLTGIPAEQLQKRVVAQKKAAAPPKPSAQQVVDTMLTINNREEGEKLLSGRTKAELLDIAKAGGIESVRPSDTKPKLIEKINGVLVTSRLESRASGGVATAPSRSGEPNWGDLDNQDLVNWENQLRVKRTSLARDDRIAALRKAWAEKPPEPEPPTPRPRKKTPASEDAAVDALLTNMRPDVRESIMADMPEADRAEVEAAQTRAQAARAARATKATTVRPPVAETLARLSNFDNPLSREEAAEMLKGYSKSQLQEMAVQLTIPGAKSANMENLRREIVETTTGRRLDSIAIRGFRGVSPTKPDTPLSEAAKAVPRQRTQAERGERLAEVRNLEAQRARQTSPRVTKAAPSKTVTNLAERREPRMTGVAPSMTSDPVKRFDHQLTDGEGRIIPRKRAIEDEAIVYPNGGADQGLMHLDSELGMLWGDLYGDDRASNSFINKLAITGNDLGRRKITLNQAIDRVRTLRDQAGDSGIGERINKALEAISSPETGPPDLPEGIPEELRRYVNSLAEIPTARKTGRVGTGTFRKSILDQVAEGIRKIATGELSPFESDQIMELPRNKVHEGTDGGFEMWDLAARVSPGGPDYMAIRRWLRSLYAKKGE